MTFLFPILLGGLALVGIPVLIHLVMRKKPKVIPFPAFRFLVQKHRKNLRKLQLRHLLLLALRVLLIAGICLALAQPRLFNEGLKIGGDRPIAAILLFDTSASMDYRQSDGQSRLEEAKKRGRELLDELPAGSRVAILDSGDAGASGKGEWLASMSQARQRLDGLNTRPANAAITTRLPGAYRLFMELTKDEAGKKLARLLCVLSDGTRACWDAGQISALDESRDQVPPVYENLATVRAGIPGLIALLDDLRANLPTPEGQEYAEQTLADSIQQLRERIGELHPDTYPDASSLTLVQAARTRLRGLAGQVSRLKDLTESATNYRQRLLDAIHATQRGLSGAHEVFIDVGVDEPTDVGIVDLAVFSQARLDPQQLFGADDKLRVRMIVEAVGKDSASSVVLEAAGKKEQRGLDLKAGQKHEFFFDLDARQLGPGLHQLKAELATKDALLANNARFVTFAIREPRKVLLIADEPAAAQTWKEAIEADRKALLACEVLTPDDARKLSSDLAKYAAVYLFGVLRPEPELWSSLKEYVQKGGSLAVVPGGDLMDLARYQSTQALEVLPAKYVAKEERKGAEAVWDWNDDAMYRQPLFKPVAEWRQLGTRDFIDSPRDGPRQAWSSWRAEGRQPPEEQVTPLARYADKQKTPALWERTFPAPGGKVIQFTTPLDTRTSPPWNNYLDRVTSFCVVLPGLTTSYLAGDTEAVQLDFLAGQGIPIARLSPADRAPRSSLVRDDIPLEELNIEPGVRELRLPQANAPGNYALKDGDGKRRSAFSVNLPAAETQLTRVPVDEIEAVFGPKSVAPVGRTVDLREALKGHWSQPVELFPLLMVLLLLTLAFENLLANKFYRREATGGEQ